MSIIISDGTGKGYSTAVDSMNRLQTRSVTESIIQSATRNGRAYNINTGTISISATSAIMYLKNDEDVDIIIDAIAVGMGTATTSDSAVVEIIKNPTTGTIISGATNVDIAEDRNFGSSRALAADAYKGASGNTFTDGTDQALFYMSAGTRLFADIDTVIPKGSSIGIRVNPNLSSGSVNVYAALITHLAD